mmetsp:Transcript_97967/g.261521  ORF Transcript_97967/g.261521 Transcript_97967/m.261521 type:complete len:301 (-) Transcript_97967:30-932(-)
MYRVIIACQHRKNHSCHVATPTTKDLVHANQITWQGLADEFPLHVHSASDDLMNNVFRQLVLEHGVQQAREVRMQALISGNQLIGEGQPRHQAPFLQPVDSAERSAEQDSLHTCEPDQALGKAVSVVHPLHRPGCFGLHCWDLFDRVEQTVLFNGVFDVLFDQERVGLTVDVLHGDLEAVERPGLRDLHLTTETGTKVLEDNPVRSREESQHVLHEVPFILSQFLPIPIVLGQVHLLRGPERCFMLLVHLPHRGVLNWEHHPPTRVLHQQHIVLLEFTVLSRDSRHGIVRNHTWGPITNT